MPGELTFKYLLTSDAGSLDDITRLNLVDFSQTFQLDVSYETTIVTTPIKFLQAVSRRPTPRVRPMAASLDSTFLNQMLFLPVL